MMLLSDFEKPFIMPVFGSNVVTGFIPVNCTADQTVEIHGPRIHIGDPAVYGFWFGSYQYVIGSYARVRTTLEVRAEALLKTAAIPFVMTSVAQFIQNEDLWKRATMACRDLMNKEAAGAGDRYIANERYTPFNPAQ